MDLEILRKEMAEKRERLDIEIGLLDRIIKGNGTAIPNQTRKTPAKRSYIKRHPGIGTKDAILQALQTAGNPVKSRTVHKMMRTIRNGTSLLSVRWGLNQLQKEGKVAWVAENGGRNGRWSLR